MRAASSEIRIVLADDHKLIIQAYSSLLSEIPGFRIVGAAGNGQEAISLLKREPADVLLLDARMPTMDGYETLKIVREKLPAVRVIMLTMYKDPAFIFNYLLHGAHAFLDKSCDQEELIRAIRIVAREGYYFSSTVSKSALTQAGPGDGFPGKQAMRLTRREMDFLKLVCEDASSEEIARNMKVSPHTVKFFKKNIYRKTNTSSTIGLIKYALRHGIFAIG